MRFDELPRRQRRGFTPDTVASRRVARPVSHSASKVRGAAAVY